MSAAALACALLIALPGQAAASKVSVALDDMQRAGQLDPVLTTSSKSTYNAARSLRKRLRGSRRLPLTNQIRLIDSLTRKNRLKPDRVRPLFTQLRVNVDWLGTNGPAASGTRSRFGKSRIYYQYFAGWGWQFHPLANFARLNAVWTDKRSAARRALGKYAYELITFGVNRNGALTWEYYFPFSGSAAPYISSISQGTAIQSLARSGEALADANLTATAARAAQAFSVRAPAGLRVPMAGGDYFAGYSGSRRLVIFNMFAQALNGLHDYATITNDPAARAIFERGMQTARQIMPRSDTGAWSLYSLGGRESNLNYHLVLAGFVDDICKDTGEVLFCDLYQRLQGYVTQPPKVTRIAKRVRRGRLYVSFRLSKISNVTVRVGRQRVVAKVGHGKRVFSMKRRRAGTVTITARDLAGNTVQVRK